MIESIKLISKIIEQGSGRDLRFFSFDITNPPNISVPQNLEGLAELRELFDKLIKQLNCVCAYHSIKNVHNDLPCVFKKALLLHLMQPKKVNLGDLK